MATLLILHAALSLRLPGIGCLCCFDVKDSATVLVVGEADDDSWRCLFVDLFAVEKG